MRLAKRRASGSPNPPASSAGVNPRGSSSSASGLPRVSARIRALTRSSSGPGIVGVQQQPGLVGGQPLDHELRQPRRARPRRRTRAARTPSHRSARSRRATNASVCADTRSSHCASSTMHTSGCSSAASASRLRTASPTRKRSGGGPALRPNAVLSASRCGPGSCSRRPSMRRAQRMQAGVRELHLGLHARRPRDPASLRGRRQVPQQGGLADPRLAAQDQHPALARAHSRDELFQRVALADTVEQARMTGERRPWQRAIIAGDRPRSSGRRLVT